MVSNLDKLVYLDAVIKEALRITPVFPYLLRITNEPYQLRDYIFPKGTVISPCMYLAHHDSENWTEPHKFMPERFLNSTANHDTMGLLAMDVNSDLSGAVTTSGMAYKIHGRVGDSPIIGAGLFVDNEIGAATSSGVGEEVIRICGTHLVVEFMRTGYSPEMACKKACERIVNRDRKKAATLQVGFLALNKKGE